MLPRTKIEDLKHIFLEISIKSWNFMNGRLFLRFHSSSSSSCTLFVHSIESVDINNNCVSQLSSLCLKSTLS